MKKLFLPVLVCLSFSGFAQKLYTKVNDSKVNSERLETAKRFISRYIEKCKNKDYSEFKDFNISKRIEKDLNTDREKGCLSAEKITVLEFNSAYILKDTKYDDPVELFIFDINHSGSSSLKYISTWVYQDKNVIDGIWISKEKPLYRNKKHTR